MIVLVSLIVVLGELLVPMIFYYITKFIWLNDFWTNVRKIIQLNEWGCRDGMHHAKNHGNKEIPLAILSRILAKSCVTLCLNYVGRG